MLVQLPSPNGFARAVATGDVQGGRYVSNLTSLTVQASPAHTVTSGGIALSMGNQSGDRHI